MRNFTIEQLEFLEKLRNDNRRFTWDQITELFNSEFNDDKTMRSLEACYHRYIKKNINHEDVLIKTISQKVRQENSNKELKINQKALIRKVINFEDMEQALKDLVKEIKPSPIKKSSFKNDKTKKNMTIELMLSDIHYGKKVEVLDKDGKRKTLCDLAIIRNRVQQYIKAFKEDLAIQKKSFNVEKIVVLFIGDIIESYTMHGLESAISSEFGNSRQIVESINSMYNDILKPVCDLGIPVDVKCVTGNHDRTEHSKTYNNAGENNVSYEIYKVLEMMVLNQGLKNIKFEIPINSYLVYKVYGANVLVEHGDNLKGNSRVAVDNLVAKRAMQIKSHIQFSRWGHFHEYTVYGRGTHIINGGVPGQDSYAEVLGFDSQATQVINYYVETKNRPTPFYKSFPVYLE